MTYKSQIVGMHFRPPAKAVLEHLPAGAELVLRNEDDNPYDEFAIQVLVSPKAVPEGEWDALREECFSMGQDWDGLVALGEALQLGFCISANNKKLGAWTPNTVVRGLCATSGTLGFDEQGVAFVQVQGTGAESDGQV